MFEQRFSINDIIQGERGTANPEMIAATSVGQLEPMGVGTVIGGDDGTILSSNYVPPREEGPTFAPPLMFGDGRNARGPRAPGQAVYPIAYNTFTPGQRGALNEYLLAGPGKDFSFGLFPALMGLLGAKTKYEQLSSGDYRPVFVGDKLYGSFGEGPFGGNVYTGLPLPSDVAAEYGIPGFDPEDDDDAPEITGTVQDPMTGQEKCPDGYIFDEDLQACRLETAAPVAAPLEARSPTRTYSLLDQAPDGLLEFQRRFGLPEQQTDFSLLT
jgi:hypothetical protein|tara:strand:- start:516 stop:1325 length:810 start_codon:yes stop_codon:yes gene_type:complete